MWWLCYFGPGKSRFKSPFSYGVHRVILVSQSLPLNSNLNLQIHWSGGVGSEMAIYFNHHNDPNWFYRWMLGLFLCKLLIELKSFEQDVIAPWLFLSLLLTPLSSQSDAIWSISLWCGESRVGNWVMLWSPFAVTSVGFSICFMFRSSH